MLPAIGAHVPSFSSAPSVEWSFSRNPTMIRPERTATAQRCDVRALVDAMRAAEPARHHALATHREQVAGAVLKNASWHANEPVMIVSWKIRVRSDALPRSRPKIRSVCG